MMPYTTPFQVGHLPATPFPQFYPNFIPYNNYNLSYPFPVNINNNIVTKIGKCKVSNVNSDAFDIMLLNVRSCRNKTTVINDLITDSNSDLVFLKK